MGAAGIYGIPLDVCARSMYEAVEAFSSGATSLKHVTFVDLSEEGAGMIAIIFQQLQELRSQDHREEEAEEETNAHQSR